MFTVNKYLLKYWCKNNFFIIEIVKQLNWYFFFPGIPLLLYGLSAILMISYKEVVKTSEGEVLVYFLLKEDKGSIH